MSQSPYCFKCEVQNSDLLDFYPHDFITFNHFPKILIEEKSQYGIMLKRTTFSVSPYLVYMRNSLRLKVTASFNDKDRS